MKLTSSLLGAALLALSAGTRAGADAARRRLPERRSRPRRARDPARRARRPDSAGGRRTPPKPFPEGAKIAYVNVQAIASNSVEGKAATSKLDELRKKKTAELAEKNKQLAAAADQAAAGRVGPERRRPAAQLEKDIEKMNRDIQFFQQDANTELQELQNQLQADFQEKLNPILEQVATEKGLHMLIDIANSGAVWANSGPRPDRRSDPPLRRGGEDAPVKK